MEVKLNVNDVVLAINKMSNEEKIILCQNLCKDDVIMKEINQHYYNVLTARENIIKKREVILNKYIEKFGSLK
jgi:hypothetical protein